MMTSLLLVSTLFGAVALASDEQLETARVTQSTQRGEFGVEGDSSAFRFSFQDPVRLLVVLTTAGCREFYQFAHACINIATALWNVAVCPPRPPQGRCSPAQAARNMWASVTRPVATNSTSQ